MALLVPFKMPPYEHDFEAYEWFPDSGGYGLRVYLASVCIAEFESEPQPGPPFETFAYVTAELRVKVRRYLEQHDLRVEDAVTLDKQYGAVHRSANELEAEASRIKHKVTGAVEALETAAGRMSKSARELVNSYGLTDVRETT